MKNVFFALLIVVATLNAAFAGEPTKKSAKAPVITFTELEHDYGTIDQGADGGYVFEFTNTGKEPLVINNVRTSCGCTVPDWSREPVSKNKKGKVKVNYNTNIQGSFTKTITVESNASNNPVVLRIKGTVTPKNSN